ncbi:methyl jasmonate esterase 1-like [Humulus lupulus]|uniref:methyl jasmonate esterase 1-like n=1 Tax=Humulus lupulus TaxID=3486 RepID=UPI002B40E6BC|nr:methyl jasmonate esterase 1-like [Humulus lupulus]
MKRVPILFVFSIIASLLALSSSNVNATTKHSHFVLVHGAGHGAWCWYKVTTLLQSTGHNVTTIDLTASGIDLSRVSQVNGSVINYAKPLMNFMASLPATAANKVVLVGHSLGGLIISLAMESFPHKISAAVFVTAAMPGPTLNYLNISQEMTRTTGSLMDSKSIFENGPNNPPTALSFGPNFMATKIYQLSPPQDLVLALSLVRVFPLFNEELVKQQVKFTKERYGSVNRVFIVCDQDLTAVESFQRWMIERNPPHELKIINGTDHMVMITRPLKLFTHLGEIAEKYSSN